MTSINFKVIGLIRHGFENARSGFETATIGFPDLPEREAEALLIRPPRLVLHSDLCATYMEVCVVIMRHVRASWWLFTREFSGDARLNKL